MSISKAAQLIGRNRQTLQEWAKRGMPIARRGETGSAHIVDLKEIIVWREEQIRREERSRFPEAEDSPLAGAGKLSPSDLLKLETLKLTRLKVGQQAEVLIPRSFAEAAFQRCLGLIRQAVMAVPERITREMAGFPEDRKLAWRAQAQDQCRAALLEGAKAIAEVMPDFEAPTGT